jgi:hypothetical protein
MRSSVAERLSDCPDRGDTGALTSALQRRIAQVDPAIVVSAVNTLDGVVLDAAAQPRLRTLVTVGLAMLTLRLQRSDCMATSGRSRRRQCPCLAACRSPRSTSSTWFSAKA